MSVSAPLPISAGRPLSPDILDGLIAVTAVAWVVLQWWWASPVSYALGQYLPIAHLDEQKFAHLGFALAIAALAVARAVKNPHTLASAALATLVVLLAAAPCMYLLIESDALAGRAGSPTTTDIVFGAAGLVALLFFTHIELSRGLVILALAAIAYLLWGHIELMPEALQWKGASFSKTISHLWLYTEGVYGISIGVAVQFIFLFVLFGEIMQRMGFGQFITKLSLLLLAGQKAGAAKAAILSSTAIGSISGSSTANVVTTGSFTIPLMMKNGMSREDAGAVEVAASSNGQLMPPIMGAAAFLIAEYTNTPYHELVYHAALPALCAFFGLLCIVHLRACASEGPHGLATALARPSLGERMAGFYRRRSLWRFGVGAGLAALALTLSWLIRQSTTAEVFFALAAVALAALYVRWTHTSAGESVGVSADERTGAGDGVKAGASESAGATLKAGASLSARTSAMSDDATEASFDAGASVSSEASAGAKAGVDSGAKASVNVDAIASAGTDGGSGMGVGGGAGTGVGAGTDGGVGSGTGVGSGAGAGLQAGAGAGAGAGVKAGVKAGAGAGVKVDAVESAGGGTDSDLDEFERAQSVAELWRRGRHFGLPVLVLLWLLIAEGLSPQLSVWWAVTCALTILLTRPALKRWFATGNFEEFVQHYRTARIGTLMRDVCVMTVKRMLPISLATACAGIIVGTITLSGLQQILGDVVLLAAGDSLALLLVMLALASLVLGLGLPTTPNYILISSLFAAVLYTATEQFGLSVSLVAIHLFILYFGVLADDTPPVGLCAYAAAAVSGGDPLRTGVRAFLLDIRTAILPFAFIFNPDLLLMNVGVLEGFMVAAAALAGMYVFCATLQSWLLVRNTFFEGALLLAASLILLCPQWLHSEIYPPWQAQKPSMVYAQTETQNTADEVVRLQLTSADGEVNKVLSFTAQAGVPWQQTIRESLGIELDANGLINEVDLFSIADDLEVSPGWQLAEVDIKRGESPHPRWLWALGAALWAFVYLLQRRRRTQILTAPGAVGT